MKAEEINKAIAEFCGLDTSKLGQNRYLCPKCGDVDANHSFDHQTHVTKWTIPNYCGDLNAMYEAEEKLTGQQAMDYVDRLDRAVGNFKHITYFVLIHATAAQRSEAFLKTIGKWRNQ